MKRTLLLASAALVALVATSFAVAKGLDGNTRSARAVAGTFTAATASKGETRTCTTSDGKTLVSTKGLYTGGGTAGGAAVELGPGRCQSTKTVNERSEAKGIISAVSSSSITVAGLTCAVPANLQSKVAGLAVNGHAEIKCSLVNAVNTLTRVEARH